MSYIFNLNSASQTVGLRNLIYTGWAKKVLPYSFSVVESKNTSSFNAKLKMKNTDRGPRTLH